MKLKKITIIIMIIFIIFNININFVNAATKSKKTTKKATNTVDVEETTEETHTVNSKDKSISNYQNTLKSLSVDGYDIYPEFNKNTVDYYVSIPKSITNLEVHAIPEYETATYKITGNNKLSSNTENLIKVVVSSEKKVSKTYTIHVNRIADNGLKLSSLSINGVTLNPTFDEDVYFYTAEIEENEIKPFTINAIANETNAKVEILGNDDSLVKGDNLISIIVTEGKDTAIYQVEVVIKDKSVLTTTVKNNKIIDYLNMWKDYLMNNTKYLYIGIGVILVIIFILFILIIMKIKKNGNEKKRKNLKDRVS